MASTYTIYQGNVLSLADRRLEDYTAEVTVALGVHEHAGHRVDGLAELGEDLNQINANFITSLGFDATGGNHIFMMLLDLAIQNRPMAAAFLESHAAVRLNTYLNTEFGPDETPTTGLLRNILTKEVVEEALADNPEELSEYFRVRMSGKFFKAVFLDGGQPALHPRLRDRLADYGGAEVEGNDPALARLVTTGLYLGDLTLPRVVEKRPLRELYIPQSKQHRNHTMHLREASNRDPDDAEADDITEDFKPYIPLDVSRAACRLPHQPDLGEEVMIEFRRRRGSVMYPGRGEDVSEAKELCASCPIENDCLAYALARNERYGIWGNTSERERRRMMKSMRLQYDGDQPNEADVINGTTAIN